MSDAVGIIAASPTKKARSRTILLTIVLSRWDGGEERALGEMVMDRGAGAG